MRCFAALLLLSAPAFAFDYVEHSYLSDRACMEAQKRLAPSASKSPEAASRYLALSLMCPVRWDVPYCAATYKQAEGSLNLIAPAKQSGDHSVTFGDLVALQDHMAELGEVKGVPQASAEGLTSRVLEWLERTGDAGGVVSDVAEDGCETLEPIQWETLLKESPSYASVDSRSSKWLRRAPARKVVQDPAGAYSFDNPQYLDLVLHNHGHFGAAAYRNWAGLHATAHQVAGADCEAVLPARATCADVARKLKLRVASWADRAAPELVDPVRAYVEQLNLEPDGGLKATALVAPLIALVFEGASLHYLQDTLSGGHVRMDRSANSLFDSRHQHDADSQNGLPVKVKARKGSVELVAFGDGYVLDADPADLRCDADISPREQTLCLIKTQRSWVVAASAASLLDLFGVDRPLVDERLPIAPAGLDGADAAIGAPPTPPLRLSYQSILLSTSVDATGGAPQLGVRTVFLTPLGQRANWMTSYHVGLLTRLGQGRESAITGELAYMFHWRWAARWLINLGPYAFVGANGFGGVVRPIAGVGPSVGTSVLPEGWIQLPLEITLSYRMPLRLYDGPGTASRGIGIDAHWVELAVGLAIM